ncbi:MAG: glycosyltransferase family 2 protein [Ferruginibacter sp.]
MISVVIIAKNEAHIIGRTLQSLQGLTDDIVVVDNGSTDGTQDICKQYNARVIETGWQGYGPTKNIGIDAAEYNWILNLDADEAIDEILKQELLQLPLQNEEEVFEMWFKNFFVGQWIKHGEWGSDKHIRLFNRNQVKWNNAAVHENLGLSMSAKRTQLKGHILHYTAHSIAKYEQKTIAYAKLNARKYFEQGKKGNFFKQYFSPAFSFLHNYFIRLGFMDGNAGFIIAKNTARYTWLKYKYLRQLHKTDNLQTA